MIPSQFHNYQSEERGYLSHETESLTNKNKKKKILSNRQGNDIRDGYEDKIRHNYQYFKYIENQHGSWDTHV